MKTAVPVTNLLTTAIVEKKGMEIDLSPPHNVPGDKIVHSMANVAMMLMEMAVTDGGILAAIRATA